MATKLYSTQDTIFFADSARPVAHDRADQLAIEEPLEIRLEYWTNGKSPTIKVCRLPCGLPDTIWNWPQDFCLPKASLPNGTTLRQIRPCGPIVEGQNFQNIVRVKLHSTVSVKTATMDRNFYTTSSCGICGKTSIEALKINNQFGQSIKSLTSPSVTQNMLFCLPERMTAAATALSANGGLSCFRPCLMKRALCSVCGKMSDGTMLWIKFWGGH